MYNLIVFQAVQPTADRYSDKILKGQIILEDDNGPQFVLLGLLPYLILGLVVPLFHPCRRMVGHGA